MGITHSQHPDWRLPAGLAPLGTSWGLFKELESLCKHGMQPVYDTVHPLLAEISQGVSRYAPSNTSAVGMPCALIHTEASRIFCPKVMLAFPDLCRLLGRRLKPAQHPRGQDREERPPVPAQPQAVSSTLPISPSFHLLGRISPPTPASEQHLCSFSMTTLIPR